MRGELESVPAVHLLHRNKSTAWFGANWTVNLYRGCCHGCIYCDSRSSCYGIADFDQICIKENALAILRDDLQRKIQPGVISLGSMSDPYNPFEAKYNLTGRALQLFDAYGFGVSIATKSDLILRDRDMLNLLSEHVPVLCKFTVTTIDEELAARVEPNAPSPTRRLAALAELAAAGLFTGVLLMPVLPFLEDSTAQVLAVVDAAAQAGAKFIYPTFGMTMREGQREHYLKALDRCFPDQGLSQRYVRQYGTRYTCASPQAKTLWTAFTRRCQEKGLLYEMKHIISASRRGYGDQQLSFF